MVDLTNIKSIQVRTAYQLAARQLRYRTVRCEVHRVLACRPWPDAISRAGAPQQQATVVQLHAASYIHMSDNSV